MICHIVAGSAHLQYILHAQINGVDDLLSPDCPFSERLELLECHEKSWSNLQLRVSHAFTAAIHQRRFLRDGYLIYNGIAGTLQYGYVVLLSASLDEELRWTHNSRDDICFPLCVVFAADHNLGVILSYIWFLSDTTLLDETSKLPSSTGPGTAHLSSLRFSSSQQARFIRFCSNPP